MRALILPIGIVGLGVVASLPFRKGAMEDFADRAIIEGVPSVVDPLQESSSGSAKGANKPVWANEALNALSDSVRRVPRENPYDMAIDQLPRSYEDVAIPLMVSDGTKNLLDQAQRVMAQPDRFGIIRQDQAGSWNKEAGIPLLETNSAVASVIETPQPISDDNPFQMASQVGEKPKLVSDDQPLDELLVRKRQFIRVPKP